MEPAEELPVVLKRKDKIQSTIESPLLSPLEENEAPLIRHARCFAPAIIQAEASPLIFSTTVNEGASATVNGTGIGCLDAIKLSTRIYLLQRFICVVLDILASLYILHIPSTLSIHSRFRAAAYSEGIRFRRYDKMTKF